ncbi:MAG: type II toxin-antitoxin system HicA family toxin [bacterium]|nr:type II toxin-antitoxin system HicA family toxin [bacterium]
MLKARDVARVLTGLGFREVRQKGAHIFFQHSDGRTTLVSRHGSEDIGRGLLRQILREIKVSPEDFFDYL